VTRRSRRQTLSTSLGGRYSGVVSEENVALVRRNYEVINSIGRTGEEFLDPEEIAPDLWARLAPDFELHGRSDIPDPKIYRGRDETKEFWRMLQEVWAELRWEPLEFTDLGDAVLVETRIVALGRGSDLRIEADETDVFWFREGDIVRLQGFPTKAAALEAVQSSDG
jgi:ketosteroid isomerase-like protein